MNEYPQPVWPVCLSKRSGRVHRQYVTPDGIDEVDLNRILMNNLIENFVPYLGGI